MRQREKTRARDTNRQSGRQTEMDRKTESGNKGRNRKCKKLCKIFLNFRLDL